MKILHANGQTCNKFFTYLNYMAESIETGEKIIILSPDINTKDYPNLRNSKILKFPFYSDFQIAIWGHHNYLNFLSGALENKYSLKIFSILFKFIPYIDFVRAPVGSLESQNKFKHELTLKFFFKPCEAITSDVELIFESIRTKFDIICGVHIRKGDYKYWKGGRYFYSQEQFNSVMMNVKRLFPNRLVAFFISSNEAIDLDSFTDCSCFNIPDSSATKDLFGLSISDYIIGPPSTFSGWASYYGNVPLYFIENPEEIVRLSSFKYIFEIWE